MTCTVEGDIATFTIKLDATGCEGVAALQFTLEPENMTQVANSVSYPESTKLTSVFNLGDIDTSKKGNFGYTEDSSGTGKFVAYGGEVKAEGGRYLSGTTKLMTVQYQLNDGAESGTLKISDFKACKSGEAAIGEDGYTCTAPESVTATRPSTGGTTLKGDVNGDGVVNIGDHQCLFEHLQKINVITDTALLAAADVNGDGSINIGDHQRLFEHLQGISLLS